MGGHAGRLQLPTTQADPFLTPEQAHAGVEVLLEATLELANG